MMIVVIVLIVLAIGFGLFKLLWLIDFFNMDGPKKSKDNAEDDATSFKENELTKKK